MCGICSVALRRFSQLFLPLLLGLEAQWSGLVFFLGFSKRWEEGNLGQIGIRVPRRFHSCISCLKLHIHQEQILDPKLKPRTRESSVSVDLEYMHGNAAAEQEMVEAWIRTTRYIWIVGTFQFALEHPVRIHPKHWQTGGYVESLAITHASFKALGTQPLGQNNFSRSNKICVFEESTSLYLVIY